MTRAAVVAIFMSAVLFAACGGDGAEEISESDGNSPVVTESKPLATMAVQTETPPASNTPSPVIAASDSIDVERDQDAAFEELKRTFLQLVDGQSGRAYDRIHPAQRELFTKDQYIACVREISNLDNAELKLKEAYLDAGVTIPGTNVQLDALALTIEMSFDGGTPETNTFREMKFDGNWYFAVANPEEVASGAC